MYWHEEKDTSEAYQAPDDVFDVVFKLTGVRLAVDHAQSLSRAVCAKLATPIHSQIGIHQVRVAESGNGWERPNSAEEMLVLSHRTKLVLRVNQDAYQDVLQLCDSELDIDGQRLTVGGSKIRKLSLLTTLFSHGIVCDEDQAETDFLADMALALRQMEINVKKLICGTTHLIRSGSGTIFTRSLMVANLAPEESVSIQQRGIGSDRLMGCGLFVPHRGIDAVYTAQD